MRKGTKFEVIEPRGAVQAKLTITSNRRGVVRMQDPRTASRGEALVLPEQYVARLVQEGKWRKA